MSEGAMLDVVNGELGAGGNNSPVSLNPKLVTHKENVADVAEDEPRSVSAPFAPTPRESIHRGQIQSERRKSGVVASLGGMGRSRSRTASVPAGARPSLSSSNPFAQRYSHVHSVVKDLIEEKITPLEAQHGRPIERQRLQSIAPASTPQFSCIPGSFYSTLHGGSGLVTPRRSSACSLQRSSQNMSRNSPSFRSSPRRVLRRGASGTPRASSVRREQSPEGIKVEPLPKQKASEHAYVLKVVDKLSSARVPYNYVPRCAQKIPERLKYHPPPSPPDTPSPPGSAEMEREISPRRGKTVTPAAAKRSSSRRTPSAGGTPRNEVASKGTRGVDRSKSHAVSDGAPSLTVSASPAGRHEVLTDEARTRSASSTRRLLEAKIRKFEAVNRKKIIDRKPLLGLERVLLFDTEPPRLLK
ncbi:uncharacterized protein Tco025E_05765 [Trypanosoma conorhini]|uniref:Uncharacterized protein n=1 Tax=Trypanosoma conorhini TaxID=83891 RepID=A0A422PAG6_9TRYP|nr:uncharacterized protein Tco025E_05765 [Trypanosoma conorhini]RNF14693.1 hypothetical protein Tco025E_05765 [Trypanosoma conorhini]